MSSGVVINSSTAVQAGGAINVSLLKMSTIVQTIVGITVTGMVMAATVATVAAAVLTVVSLFR